MRARHGLTHGGFDMGLDKDESRAAITALKEIDPIEKLAAGSR
jgi:hypothetical protein